MLIILAVIVLFGVIFLMIYNSKSTRKAAEARASKTAVTDEGLVLIHEEESQRNGRLHEPTDSVEQVEHSKPGRSEPESLDSTIEESTLSHENVTGTKDGDHAYRQALLHFRKQPELEEEQAITVPKEAEKSADEIYRSALKEMKNKSSDPSSGQK